MLVSAFTPTGDRSASWDLPAETTISALKMLVQTDMGIPIAKQVLKANGSILLNDALTLQQAGVTTDPIIVDTQRRLTLQDVPNALWRNPQQLQIFINENPTILADLRKMDPQLAEAIESPTHFLLEALLINRMQQRRQREAEEARRIAMLNADPLNPEAQAAIADTIRQSNVQQNMEAAIEYNPESFGRVTMLYVPCQVNGKEMVGFVDSGAQMTIMSQRMAEQCGIMRLLDTRFAGIAKGVGTSKILGRVFNVPVKLGKTFIQCAFSVLENQDMDFLLGLDQLKQHKACIDLDKGALRIGGEEIPFLSEKDLPDNIRAESAGVEDEKMPQHTPNPSSNGPTTIVRPGPSTAVTSSSPGQPLVQPLAPQALSAPASSATPQRGLPNGVTDAALAQLQALGFPRDASIQALLMYGGNVEMAAASLMGLG